MADTISSHLNVVSEPSGDFDPSTLQFTVRRNESNYEKEEADPWLKIFLAVIKTSDGKKVGQLGYRVIHKSVRIVQPPYYNIVTACQISEVGGQDLESFAQVLYNGETGNLKQAFVDGDRKGTGVFGNELNIGSFAMLSDDQVYKGDDFCIEPEFRGKGIGSWALQKLLQHKSIQRCDFIFAQPWATRIPQAEWRTPEAIATSAGVVQFFRKAGFRRVGDSAYFAYALADPSHPSRSLSIEDDAAILQRQ